MDNIIIESNLNNLPIERNDLCDICNLNVKKQKCPRCLQKICSVKCSKVHKSSIDCSGISTNNFQIAKNEQNSQEFKNDLSIFKTLDDNLNSVMQKSSKIIRGEYQHKQSKFFNITRTFNGRLFKVRKFALKQGQNFGFSPFSFQRNKINKSMIRREENRCVIYWWTELRSINVDKSEHIGQRIFSEEKVFKDFSQMINYELNHQVGEISLKDFAISSRFRIVDFPIIYINLEKVDISSLNDDLDLNLINFQY